MEIAAIAGAGSSAIGALKGADAARDQQAAHYMSAYHEREMSEYNAELIREGAKQQADRVFEAARRLRGEQRVAQAAQGIVIGEGSAAAVQEDTFNLAARDALVTLYGGIDGQLTELKEGEMAFRSGMNQGHSAGQQAEAALIQGIAGIANSFSTYKGLTTKRT